MKKQSRQMSVVVDAEIGQFRLAYLIYYVYIATSPLLLGMSCCLPPFPFLPPCLTQVLLND
jgi:hypothetical protein